MEKRASRLDYEDFLLRAYFGSKDDGDLKAACIHRAYLDFNRTLSGIATLADKEGVHKDAVGRIKLALRELSSGEIGNQEEFDSWHRHTCMCLKSIYENRNFLMKIGQTQKWINMTIKYIYTFGDERIRGFDPIYPLCHVPLDNQIINNLQCYEPPELSLPWSGIDCYDQYLRYQKWIRETFTILPLDLELFAWKNPNFKLKEHWRKSPSTETLS